MELLKRTPRRKTSDLSRGADIWLHQTRQMIMTFLVAGAMGVLVGLAIASSYLYMRTTEYQRTRFADHLLAELRLTFMMTAGPMELTTPQGRVKSTVQKVHEATEPDFEEMSHWIKVASMHGALWAIVLGAVILVGWRRYGARTIEDQMLRGAELVSGEKLKHVLDASQDASPYTIAGVPMRKGSETLHAMFAGAQGTGKSQEFFDMMRQVRGRRRRAIVYDPTGEYTAAFFREGKDILLNPLDKRSPLWTVWNEIRVEYHYDNIAAGLVPEPPDKDPFWHQASRHVFKEVIRVLGRDGRTTNHDLYTSIAAAELEALHALVMGTPGSTYMDPKTERTGLSIKMTLQNYMEAFRFLPDDGKKFSIRDWVSSEDEEDDSWVFFTCREQVREALKPVLSLWIDTAIKSVLDLTPIHRERLWMFIDELPTLQKLDVLGLALTNTRKYGLCMVIGVQDIPQLVKTYGVEMARTIVSGCQTKLLLRVTDADAANQLSSLIGEAEMDEHEENISYGLSAERDGVSLFGRRNIRKIVLGSEILRLPDMTGYLIIPGPYPAALVSYQYVPVAKIASDFVPRPGYAVHNTPVQPAVANSSSTSAPIAAAEDGEGGGNSIVTIGSRDAMRDSVDMAGPAAAAVSPGASVNIDFQSIFAELHGGPPQDIGGALPTTAKQTQGKPDQMTLDGLADPTAEQSSQGDRGGDDRIAASDDREPGW